MYESKHPDVSAQCKHVIVSVISKYTAILGLVVIQLAEGCPQAVTGQSLATVTADIANMTLAVGMHVLQLHLVIIHATKPPVGVRHPGLSSRGAVCVVPVCTGGQLRQ